MQQRKDNGQHKIASKNPVQNWIAFSARQLASIRTAEHTFKVVQKNKISTECALIKNGAETEYIIKNREYMAIGDIKHPTIT